MTTVKCPDAVHVVVCRAADKEAEGIATGCVYAANVRVPYGTVNRTYVLPEVQRKLAFEEVATILEEKAYYLNELRFPSRTGTYDPEIAETLLHVAKRLRDKVVPVDAYRLCEHDQNVRVRSVRQCEDCGSLLPGVVP